ncbi:lamin tail domain-containing protein [Dokdonella sp. MW10]|uniref:lamin tail domain-containing protein n=1 Tax=Dokdonella sp. MW10 TaxID=2992926 RepID=UPI003F7DB3A9
MFRHLKLTGAALLIAGASTCAHADIVISQAYGGGGNSGAVFTNDFIELFNNGTTPENIGGWSVQYTSAAGTTWNNKTDIPAGVTLQPGQYYLIQQAAGNNTIAPLPAPDLVGTIAMGGTAGKVILVRNTTSQTGACPTGAALVDLVGYGPTANCPNPTAVLTNGTAAIRKTAGCTNTGSNNADFDVATPTPRNSATTAAPCGGTGPGTPVLSMADVSIAEGNTGTTPFVFTAQLSAAAPAGGVTFSYATADGSATAGSDYTAVSGTATIIEGATTTTITVLVNGDTDPEPNETFSLALTGITGATPASLTATGTILNDDIATLAIHAIQGPGAESPVVGQRVQTVGNIVTARGPAGFFMQTPDNAVDNDPMTSEGIYVYTGSTPTVQVGDEVTLTGNVIEYFGLTEINAVSGLSVTNTSRPLPTAVVFDATTPSQDPAALSCGDTNFECFEGMLVQIDNGIVARGNQYFSTDTYAQIFASASGERSLRSPGTLYPLVPGTGNPAAGAFLGNPHVFEIDADVLGAVPANTAITGGSRFTATGVVSYSFGDYEVWPTSFTVTEPNVLPRAVPAGQQGDELRIGSFNVLRLCDTDATNTSSTCGNGGEPNAAALQLKLARLSDYIGNVLKTPDVLGVVEVENLAVLQLLADKILADHGVAYTAYLEEGNDVGGIDVGYLVHSGRVSNVTVTQLDKTETWVDPRDGQTRTLHDRPALLLEATFGSEPFATIVVHPKSRSCVDAPTGTSCTLDEVNRNRAKRFTQAKSMALRVQEQQTNHPTRPLLVIGDYNDYVHSDGFVHITGLLQGTYDDAANTVDLGTPNIVSPPLWNAVTSLPANEQYSFLFTEQFGEILGYTRASATSIDRGRDVPIMQVLDHAMLNGPAKAWFAGFAYGRANLDAADQDERNSTTAIGVSDHDGLVVRLATDRVFADSFGGE